MPDRMTASPSYSFPARTQAYFNARSQNPHKKLPAPNKPEGLEYEYPRAQARGFCANENSNPEGVEYGASVLFSTNLSLFQVRRFAKPFFSLFKIQRIIERTYGTQSYGVHLFYR